MDEHKKLPLRKMIPLFHFLLSFLYERRILLFTLKENIVASQPMNDVFSVFCERVIAYLFSKLIAAVFICVLWRVVFFVKDRFLSSGLVRSYVILYAVGFLLLAFCWPSHFLRSGDNVITYSYAIRLLPEYWHNAYSGYIYCAALMVFPHPVAISVLQWTFFVFAAGYFSHRAEKSPVLKGSGKWLPILFFLIPGIWDFFMDAYRTEQYSILAIVYLTLVTMDILEHKGRTAVQLTGILLLCIVVSVWRTEGIIVGLFTWVILLVFGYRFPLKKTALWVAAFAVGFLLLNFPNRIGEIKYYGRDYAVVNSFSVLQNILNHPDARLHYGEAEADLRAISEITPVEAIRLYGLDGYRRYNVLCGRRDINQSMASGEASSAFLKAYYRLVIYNPRIYAKTQLSMFASIIGISQGSWELEPIVEDTGAYPKWTYDAWDVGKEDYCSAAFVMPWANLYFRQIVYVQIQKAVNALAGIRGFLKLDFLYQVLVPILQVLIVLREAIRWIRRKYFLPGVGGVCLTMLILLGALILVMPAGLRMYFHPYYFMSLVPVGVYGAALLRARKTGDEPKDGAAFECVETKQENLRR